MKHGDEKVCSMNKYIPSYLEIGAILFQLRNQMRVNSRYASPRPVPFRVPSNIAHPEPDGDTLL